MVMAKCQQNLSGKGVTNRSPATGVRSSIGKINTLGIGKKGMRGIGIRLACACRNIKYGLFWTKLKYTLTPKVLGPLDIIRDVPKVSLVLSDFEPTSMSIFRSVP